MKPIELSPSEDTPIAQHCGKWSLSETRVLELSEAVGLIKAAIPIIEQTERLARSAPMEMACRQWLLKCRAFGDERIRVLTTGDDWRKGL